MSTNALPAAIGRGSRSIWSDRWRVLKKHRPAMLSLGLLVLLAVFCFSAPIYAAWMGLDPNGTDLLARFNPPSEINILGTDEIGRDVLLRLMYGGQISLSVGLLATAFGCIIGVTIGLGLFAVAQSDAMVWVAISVFGLANGLFLPSISSLVSFETDAGSRGAVMGIFNASSSAGRILGPAISGPLYFKLGPAAPFVFSAASTALGALMLSRARARKSDEAN